MAARRLWKGLEICQSYVTVNSRDKFNLLKTLSARSQDTKNPGLRICARGICFYQGKSTYPAAAVYSVVTQRTS